MSQVIEDLAAYAARLGERPAEYTRTRHWEHLWGTDAWEYIPASQRQGLAYGLIEDLWGIALGLMGLGSSEHIDQRGFEDLSVQFYALYADMILEYIRNTK